MIFNIDSGLPGLFYDFGSLVRGTDWDWYNGESDANGNWAIQFWKTGSYNIDLLTNKTVDIHCVGGGAAGADGGWNWFGNGGGGGYTNTASNIRLTGKTFTVTVGAGGVRTSRNGGTSSFSSLCSASGGQGKNGGSGGGAGGIDHYEQGWLDGAHAGGSNGGNGVANATTQEAGGVGQGRNTYDFGNSSLTLRGGGAASGAGAWGSTASGGAGGGGSSGQAGTNRYGGGGSGGTRNGQAFSGGSGIVIIRNHR